METADKKHPSEQLSPNLIYELVAEVSFKKYFHLLADKQAGANEYLRVARSGARIGLNEATWVRTPPRQGWSNTCPTPSAFQRCRTRQPARILRIWDIRR